MMLLEKKRHNVSVYDFHNIKYRDFDSLFRIEHKTEISYPPRYWNSSGFQKEKRILPAINLLNIKKCTVIGGSNIILVAKKIGLYNHNSENEVNYSDAALQSFEPEYKINKKTTIYEKRWEKRKNIEEGISLCINYNFNYYHFIIECLSKFYVLDSSKLRRDIPIIIDSTVRDIKQFRELFDIFNRNNREVIYLDRLQYANVKNLYVISPIHYLPANYLKLDTLKASSVTFNLDCIKYIRERVLSGISVLNIKSSNANKIFISRHNIKARTYNNDEIEIFLNENDYKIIHPESMSFEDQVLIFHNASEIVAASGAALTNIIFCKPGTKIIVLANQKLNLAIFSNLAECFGLNMMYLVGSFSDSKSLHSSFYIDIKDLSRVICKMS